MSGMESASPLRAIDTQFARFVERLCEGSSPSVAQAAALASHAVGEGFPGCDLAALAGGPFPGGGEDAADAAGSVHTLPPLAAWLAELRTEAARRAIGGPGDGRPLVLEGTRLYLRRYWTYECRVRDTLRRLASAHVGLASLPTDFEARLEAFFPATAGSSANPAAQRDAARKACQRHLAILSGGPGTGKTYTLARAVALLAESRTSATPLRVRVAAPTGKAAARVVESLRNAKAEIPASPAILAQIPEEATTIHRLLGPIPGSPYFRHDRETPLDADVVVVDEASMVDLPLMAKLLDALPPACRLVLVGDRDQLASVEPGRVYGDLCEQAGRDPDLRACLAELTFSHRFPAHSDVGRLSAAIRTGQADALREPLLGDVRLHAPSTTGLRDSRGLPAEGLRTAVREGYARFLAARTPAEALAAANEFRVLCALRHGPCGVHTLNRLVEEILAGPDGRGQPRLTPTGLDYDHRLVAVTVNDYSLGLFNGDVGVILRDPATGIPTAWFEATGPDGGRGARGVPAALLPEHETAFAMTIHKSQGSEFGRIALILPPDPDTPVLTRELLYTGLTRTRRPVDLWCTDAVFRAAVARRARAGASPGDCGG